MKESEQERMNRLSHKETRWGNWGDRINSIIFLGEMSLQPRILYPTKLSLNCSSKLKTIFNF